MVDAACRDRCVLTEPARAIGPARGVVWATGLPAMDQLMPRGGLACGAMHEVLGEEGIVPWSVALVMARAAAGKGAVVWCDSQVYPPAVLGAGLALDRFFLLRPPTPRDEVWATAECLRCKGVAAVVAAPNRLSRIEARRLQLAAETGGGIGILLRRPGPSISHYAAATRWRVRAIAGTEVVQRWEVQLIHGHGGRVGESILLEVCRDSNHVRAIDVLADRSNQAQTSRASA